MAEEQDFTEPVDWQINIADTTIPSNLNLSGNLVVGNASIPPTTLQNVIHMDVEQSLNGIISGLQPLVTNTTDLELRDLSVHSINNVSSTKLGYLSNISSDVQQQINSKQPTITETTDLTMSDLTVSTLNSISSTTLGYVDPTSSIQTQLNSKQPTITETTDLTMSDLIVSSLNNISSTTLGYIDATSSIQTQLNSKQATITETTDLTMSDLTVNTLNSISSTTLGYIDATSSIQTQINSKQPTITSLTDLSMKDLTVHSLNNISSTTLGYIDPTSSIQTQLNSKTTLSAVQSNGNTFTVQNQFDNYAPICVVAPSTSSSLANKQYVDGKISELIGGASTAYDTLLEIQNILQTDGNNINSLLTAVDGCAKLSAGNTFSGNNVFSGQDTFSNTNTFSGNSIYSGVTLSPAQMSKIQYLDISSSLATQLSGKQDTISNISSLTGYVAPVDLTSSQTIAGIKTFTSPIVSSGASITSGTIPDAALASTFLKTSVAASTYCDLANTQTIAGIKTFSSPPVMSGASISSGTIPASALVQTYLTTTNAASSYCDLTNTQTIGGTKTFSSPPVMSGASISSGTIPASALAQTYLTTSSASSTYQPLLSSSVSATLDLLTANRITEKVVSVTGTTSTTLNYSLGSVFYWSSTQPSSNFSVSITNIPASSSSNQFTITLIYNSSTACYCNSVSVSDASSATIVASGTPKWIGGSAPTLTNSAIYIQTFTILQMYTTKYCLSNVVTFN